MSLKLKLKEHKQNKTVIRTVFVVTTHGKDTESAFPLMNLLDILSVTSIFKLQALKFAHRWHGKALPNISDNYFQCARAICDMLVIKIFMSHEQGPTLENNLFLQ